MSALTNRNTLVGRVLIRADGTPGYYLFILPTVSAPAGEVEPRRTED